MSGKTLDKLDIRLLSELFKDSRTSFSKLSKILKVPRTTIINRVERLIKNGIVRKFTIIPGYQNLGYIFLAFVLVRVRRGGGVRVSSTQVSLAKRILEESSMRENLPWVEEAHIITGEYDILLKVRAKNWEEISRFLIEYLAGLEEVEHTNTLLCLLTVDEQRTPPLARDFEKR
ncbi:MAG: Lrp/AsnC family transcriptional regulator [Thermoproteales archaeon]|nr:Lrp/AsnC family transcriptional regulator [Thermoproteales archaeon]RLE65703.1 MAG: Lrp/AsnC family transcriptional regulator [Thermoprotei archaeon]